MNKQKRKKKCNPDCVLPIPGSVMNLSILLGIVCLVFSGCGHQENNMVNSATDLTAYDLACNIINRADNSADKDEDYLESESPPVKNTKEQTKLNYNSVDFVIYDEGHVYSGIPLYVPCAVWKFTENIDTEWNIFSNLVEPLDIVNVQFEGGETNLSTMAVNPDKISKLSVDECVMVHADIYISNNVTLELFGNEVIVTNVTKISDITEVLGMPSENYHMTESRIYTYNFNDGYIDFITNTDDIVYYIMITVEEESIGSSAA